MELNDSAIQMVKDPVCGMNVLPGRARSWDYLYQEIVYHFCGPDCRSRFQADAKRILLSGPGQTPPATATPKDGEGEIWGYNLRKLFKKWGYGA